MKSDGISPRPRLAGAAALWMVEGATRTPLATMITNHVPVNDHPSFVNIYNMKEHHLSEANPSE